MGNRLHLLHAKFKISGARPMSQEIYKESKPQDFHYLIPKRILTLEKVVHPILENKGL
jgi:hypothetical protein